jgi:hypothetical protein
MATNQRIYKVTSGDKTHLVQATSQAQALRHVAGKTFGIEVAKSIDVAALMSKGISVETAVTMPEQGQLDVEA